MTCAACSSPTVEHLQTVSDLFPAEWAADCDAPSSGPLVTNSDLIDGRTEDRASLRDCGSRMKRIKGWRARQVAADGQGEK